jgi:hypothetical protein
MHRLPSTKIIPFVIADCRRHLTYTSLLFSTHSCAAVLRTTSVLQQKRDPWEHCCAEVYNAELRPGIHHRHVVGTRRQVQHLPNYEGW